MVAAIESGMSLGFDIDAMRSIHVTDLAMQKPVALLGYGDGKLTGSLGNIPKRAAEKINLCPLLLFFWNIVICVIAPPMYKTR